ncbi:hypothetical protein BDZ90DRAFT_72760 [Jaminaea rosea]|uniref:P-loop containing nucleoside triphosphate hydrolase protein n=1 Tax=Jaminaea rosea TaxID=1569628 RepID=A0A316UKJ3_9BASI|nr:hypothetical protein BDZ90DRAFT_72760 [Jaminaea rosea]PWN25318.1 hypothetical protein BDZ90DRAFT_72760 [Jaminaea rosea]
MALTTQSPLCANDASWGPISDCRHIDLTLLFQHIVLSAFGSVAFILTAVITLWRWLISPREKAAGLLPHRNLNAKIALACALLAARLSVLGVLDHASGSRWPATAVAATSALALSASLLLIPTLAVLHGHKSAACPRTRLILYYAFQCSASVATIRSLRATGTYAYALIAVAFITALLLLLEIIPRSAFHPESEQDLGLVWGSLLAWTSPLLIAGLRRPLVEADLLALDANLDAHFKGATLLKSPSLGIDNRGTRLIWAFTSTFPAVTLAPVIPRIILMCLQLLQPIIIERLVDFVSRQDVSDADRWSLVGGISLLYLGIALTGSVYWGLVFKATLAFRSAMVPAIFRSMLVTSSSAGSDAATLMSVDMERITMALQEVHEIWIAFPTIAIGSYMLYERLGVAFLSCLGTVITLVCCAVLLSMGLPALQKSLLQATERRATRTSRLFAQLKTIVLSSYQSHFASAIAEIRCQEVSALVAFMQRVTAVSMLATSTTNFAVVVVLAVAWSLSQHDAGRHLILSPAVVFSSLSVITIIEAPIVAIGQKLGTLFAATASFGRIQTYLHQAAHTDSWSVEPDESIQLLLQALQRQLQLGTGVLRLIGSAGTGKSTALRKTLHSLQQSTGVMVGYVPQGGSLYESLSVRDNIVLCSGTPLDSGRLDACLVFCCFDEDLARMPDGLETQASQLSGGQRQRVATMRALYSHSPLLALDDSLSALDVTTASTIRQHLMSGVGLMARRLLIFVSHDLDNWDARRAASVYECVWTEKDGYALRQRESSTITVDEDLPSIDGSIPNQNRWHAAVKQPRATEDIHSDRLGWAPYRFYLASAYLPWLALCIVTAAIGMGGFYIVKIVVQQWVRRGTPDGKLPDGPFWLAMLSASTLASAFILCASSFINVSAILPSFSRKIHERALRGVFAKTAFSGSQLTNRFTQDIAVVDLDFPKAFHTTFAFIIALGGIVATFIAAVPLMAVFLPFIGACYWLLQRVYTRASRQIRSMELESKTSLFAIFRDASEAREVVHFLRGQPSFQRRCDDAVNQTQRAFYTRLTTLRFLVFALYALTWIAVSIMAALAVALRHKVSPTLLGVAMNSVTVLAQTLEWCAKSFAMLETAAVAVNRLRELVTIEEERVAEANSKLLLSSTGCVALELSDISAKRIADGPGVLEQINLSIRQGERVAITGRTGSGKSTLITAILRAFDDESLIEGEVKLGGQSWSEVSADKWRESFSYVAQEPLVWEASVRELLTVGSEDHLEATLWEALEIVGLAERVRASAAGIEAQVVGADDAQGPEACLRFSCGKLQLLAFARAILEIDRPFMLLDETDSRLDVGARPRYSRLSKTVRCFEIGQSSQCPTEPVRL